ncbi:MAG: hypothetical protein GXO34_00115, partial [Deltaproteobacteria bacterium]|nr:hypothetical protein [Deltaproteobacteria bacterium]
GMTLHFIIALLLLAWGTILLKSGGEEDSQNPEPGRGSRAWLLLALPCPVCFSVILFSGAFLHHLWPGMTALFVWLGAAFITLALAAALLFHLSGNRQRPEAFLGTVMILAALYFLVTIAVVPQFADIERIYRLSQNSVGLLPGSHRLLLLSVAGLAFICGYLRKTFKRNMV